MKCLFSILLFIYIFISFLALIMGLTDSGFKYLDPCSRNSRIKTIFFTYKLGCWLGEETK